MDQTKWAASEDPKAMLSHVLPRADHRRLRLLTAAAFRYLLSRGEPPATSAQLCAVAELERFADDESEAGLFDAWRSAGLPRPGIALATVAAAKMHADMIAEYPMPDMRRNTSRLIRATFGDPFAPVEVWEECDSCGGSGFLMSPPLTRPRRPPRIDGGCAKCEIKGRVAPDWLTPAVRDMALVLYRDREPDGRLDAAGLLALSDALEEAGLAAESVTARDLGPCVMCRGEGSLCRFRGPGVTNPYWADCPSCLGRGRRAGLMTTPNPIIAALREPAARYRGFWALDAILGK